ncbi:hypothetical protein CCL14_26010 [Pseudomonas syringae]|nr:hypothetical protein CCL14_26010 [Pseudomonas syringae]
MIQDFQVVLEALDSAVSTSVVKDKGLSLAIYRTLLRDGAMLTTDLMQKLTMEWRLGTNRKVKIHKSVQEVGGIVKQLYANTYQVSV